MSQEQMNLNITLDKTTGILAFCAFLIISKSCLETFIQSPWGVRVLSISKNIADAFIFQLYNFTNEQIWKVYYWIN